ncbi:MAG: hypothetical protein Q4D55_09565 [Eubacteriales bacterium]|nr:hypothetical protein [Eubacteriales bacterium]
MQKKDLVFKRFIRNPERFADLVNGIFFSGDLVIRPEFLKRMPVQRILRLETVHTEGNYASQKRSTDAPPYTIPNGELENRNDPVPPRTPSNEEPGNPSRESFYLDVKRDCLWQHTHPDMPCLLACEGQSRADYTMPLREYIYDGADYGCLLEERPFPKQAQTGVSRPLLPIFSMVLYLGEHQWLSKHSLQEMMYFTEKSRSYRHLLPDYKVHLADIHEQDPSLFRSEWKGIFSLMAHSRKKEDLRTYITTHRAELDSLSPPAQEFLLVLLDYNHYNQTQDEKGVSSVCQAWDDAMNDYKTEGRIEGILEGRTKGKIEGILEVRIEGRIENTIQILLEFGQNRESIIDRLTSQFELSRSDAEEKFALYSASISS